MTFEKTQKKEGVENNRDYGSVFIEIKNNSSFHLADIYNTVFGFYAKLIEPIYNIESTLCYSEIDDLFKQLRIYEKMYQDYHVRT